MAYKIVVDISGQPASTPGVGRTFPFSLIEAVAPVVELSLDNSDGVTSYLWEFLSQPPGASASMSSPTAAAPTFEPAVGIFGTYVVRCTTDGIQSFARIGVAFSSEVHGLRDPGVSETLDFDATAGWSPDLRKVIESVDSPPFGVVGDSSKAHPLGMGSIVSARATYDGAEKGQLQDLVNIGLVLHTQDDNEHAMRLSLDAFGTDVAVDGNCEASNVDAWETFFGSDTALAKAVAPDPVHAGVRSLSLENTHGSSYLQLVAGQEGGLTVGQAYRLSFWVYSASATTVEVGVGTGPSTFVLVVGDSSTFDVPAGAWTYVEVAFRATGPDFYISVGAAAAGFTYLDDVLVQEDTIFQLPTHRAILINADIVATSIGTMSVNQGGMVGWNVKAAILQRDEGPQEVVAGPVVTPIARIGTDAQDGSDSWDITRVHCQGPSEIGIYVKGPASTYARYDVLWKAQLSGPIAMSDMYYNP